MRKVSDDQEIRMKIPSFEKFESLPVEASEIQGRVPSIKPNFMNKFHSYPVLTHGNSSGSLAKEIETPSFTPKRKLKFSQKVKLHS